MKNFIIIIQNFVTTDTSVIAAKNFVDAEYKGKNVAASYGAKLISVEAA